MSSYNHALPSENAYTATRLVRYCNAERARLQKVRYKNWFKHHKADCGDGTHHSDPFKGENGRSEEKRESAHGRRQGDVAGVSEILRTKRQRKLEIITERERQPGMDRTGWKRGESHQSQPA